MNSESLISYIHQIMNSDGPLRKDLESQLLFLSKSNPLIYFQASIMLLYSSQTVPSDIRLFAILHLKKVFSDSSFQSQLNQVELLKEVSVLLKKEPNMQILGFISEFYGEIAGKLLKDFTLKNDSEGIITNDLLNNDVWELLSTNEEQKVVSGLMILIKLIEIGFEEFLTLFQENLFAIIKKMLTSPNDQIVKTVIKLIVKILTHVDYSLCKKYVPLIPDILEILFVLLNQKNIEGEHILSDFYDIAESEPKALIQTFPLLTSKTLDLHANTAISIGIKQQTLELILSVIERVPKSLSLSQHTLEGLFQMVFLHLMSLEEIDFNDSFSEETDAEFENVRFGREAIDRIMGSLGGKPILEIFSIYIQKLLQMKDWKFTFSALMGLSQVGEYLEEINEIEGSIELILNYSNHPHPMIRYAVCHTLGQLSSDMKPEFQMKYHQRILPLLINILEDDSVLVQCHGAAALSNFIDGMNLQPLFEYLNTIVPKLLKYIKGSTGKLKEQLINALSNTSKIARDTFIPYMKESLDLLISIIKNTIQDNFKVLRGVILATITQIAASVGFEQFHDYIEDLFSFLRAVPPANLFEVHEIVIAWKRTLIFLPPEQLIHYMNEKIWNDIIAMPELCQENPQDFEETLRLLQIFLEKVPLNYLTPYFEKISNLLIPLTSSGNLNPIRIISLKGLPFLLNILKLGNKKKQEDLLIKGFLDLILKMNDEKIDLEVRSQLMRTLLCLINEKNENNLDKLDFEQVLRLIWGNIEKSMGKKIQLDRKKNENYEEDEEDEDMEELLNEDIKEENEFLILMGELLAAIFRKFQEFLIDFKVIDTFLLDLAPKAIDLGLYKFILYTLDDMMDEINLLDLLIPHRTSIFTLLMNSIEDLNCEIRQASLYGIGVFVEKFKMLDFLDMTVIENIRVKIIEAIKMKKNKESNNTYGLCKDNAISALGKLFRAHHDKINLKQTIQIWLEALPIKYDVKEALIQYDLLFNALNSDPNIIIMDSSDNLEKIFKIIGEIYGTHLINEEIREQILKFVMNIMNLKNYDFEKFGTRLKEMNPSALKRLEQCFQDVKQMK